MDIKQKQKNLKTMKINFKNKNKINMIMLNIFIIILSLPLYAMQENKHIKRKLNFENEITIKIAGTGKQFIVHEWGPATPSEIYLNGELQASGVKFIDVGEDNDENIITMKFNSPLTNVDKLFFYLSNIKEIDLSKFDSSSITSMGGMFRGCSSLTSIEFGNFNTSSVGEMTGMFQDCSQLISLDLSSFDASKVTGMSSMFFNCANLKYLNVDNFNTINLVNMNSMFYGCKSLTTLDLSNFTTSNVVNMQSTFTSCTSLISLNLDNFDTSQVTVMSLIFYSCESLISLNINSFNTSSLGSSHDLFTNVPGEVIFCADTSKVSSISTEISSYNNDCNNICFSDDNSKILVDNKECIHDCKEDDTYQYEYNNICYITCPTDTYVSIDNMYLCQVNPEGYYLDGENIYQKCYESCKFCNGEGDINNHNCISCKSNYKNLEEIGYENNCYPECEYFYYINSSTNYYCTEENSCPTNYNKIINEKKKCIDECKNDDTYIYEYNNICYSTCPSNTYLKNDNINVCYKEPEGYYLDTDDIYKPCYSLCKSCKKEGNETNNNCNECISSYHLILNPNNINNCYEKCNYYYYFDSAGNYHCTSNQNCPEEQSKLITTKSQCIDDCTKDDVYKFEENNICVKVKSENGKILICPINLPCEKNSECIETCTAQEFLEKECIINNKNNQTVQDNIIKSIKTEITNGNLNSIISNIKDGDKNDYILQDNDAIYQITSSDNQNNNEYNNISSILLGDCEQKLKDHYKIDKDEPLIIFKIDIKEEGLKIPIIEYEIYNPYNLEKLELDVCKDIKINISIPVSIDEDSLFKYNSSDEYYNDICYSYTTENDTDITVKDRQNEYKENNMSLCESNCDYTYYNSTTKKAICNCKVKNNIGSVSAIKQSKDLLLTSFSNLKNSINLEIMKCYKTLFTKEGLMKNFGSYILLFILFIQIISFFIFISKGYNVIYNLVNNLTKLTSEIKENKNKSKNNIKNKNTKRKTNININIAGNIYCTHLKKKSIRSRIKSKSQSPKKAKKTNKHNPNKKSKNRNSNKFGNDYLNSKNNTHSKLNLKYSEKRKYIKKSSKRFSLIKSDNNNNDIRINDQQARLQLKFLNYNDYEINNLEYEQALLLDKRTYVQYYWSLLKQKHLLIFTFYTSNDYNSKIIKICIFFFSFALLLTVNALFFNYKTLHKIYEDKGAFNFIFQIPQIILSTVISTVINMLIKTLSLTQKNILEIKNVKENINSKKQNLLGCLKIKFTFYFLFSFIFLLFFWYYLASFCCVYSNTQKHLIKDSSLSFVLSLLYPIFINLMPGFFRIPSLKAVNKNKEFTYKLSQIIQLI